MTKKRIQPSIFMVLAVLPLISCSTALDLLPLKAPVVVEPEPVLEFVLPEPEPEPEPEEEPAPPSEVVRIPVVVQGSSKPMEKSSIVIAAIGGPCQDEVKDALMLRLVDNADYQILTRDNLQLIVDELENNWSGKFNTRTAKTLGDFIAASFFIVGNVSFCGPVGRRVGGETKTQTEVTAVLQVLDLQTGRVLLSSADTGVFRETTAALLKPDMSNSGDAEEGEKERPVNYKALKAAEELANRFADKFFARPRWENLEMWKNPNWHYGDGVRYVKLGHCNRAVDLLRNVGNVELEAMPELYVAEYLHNYGVALLCDNQIDPAMSKLRASYRIAYHATTLRMLDIAGRLDEWDLEVQVENEPEVDLLLRRSAEAAEAAPAQEHEADVAGTN